MSDSPGTDVLSRRRALQLAGGGFAATAFDSMLSAGESPHHQPKATRVIQIFCPGGMSQVDTFDYKPELQRRAGQPFDPDGKLQFFASKPGNCQPGFWRFRQHGESGRWISSLFPGLARHVDEMAFIYSMHSKSALHGPGCFMMNTGFTLPGFPSMGSWVTYGLGSESNDLPSFVVLPDPSGLPPGGIINWGAGFLPAVHQATTLNTKSGQQPIADLFPPTSFAEVNRAADTAGLRFLERLNRRHLAERNGNSDLDARIKAYELAARLQLSAPEVTNLSSERDSTQQMYAIEDKAVGPFGRQCLLARRLIERGVRFVQIYCGAENTQAKEIRPNWDSHEDLVRDHGYWGRVLDTGASALLADLKQRGLLDETLVMCTTEFGRQPAAQGKRAAGRDHNAGAFTSWLAGGGIKGGVGYGATDDLGFKAVDHPTYSYDLHATALHLLGIDHTRLTFYHNGIERRLTDVHGHVIDEVLA
ncbi:MAG TPA: DUF1501 domain-containing protein [Planctomycetes bacterium]|nr:DUF1501 domain-containing protein [Fuerstiella sp.]HIK94075.1 DUF1501 domain-containing protein [Planctomycetota bacterium]